jgi:hypothetical protein
MSNLSTVPEQKRYGLIKPMGVAVSKPAALTHAPHAPAARGPPRSSAALTRAFAADDDDAFDEDDEGVGGRGKSGGVSDSARREVHRVNRDLLARSAATAAAIERQIPGALGGDGVSSTEVDYLDYDGAYDSMKQQQHASQSALASRLSGTGQAHGGAQVRE